MKRILLTLSGLTLLVIVGMTVTAQQPDDSHQKHQHHPKKPEMKMNMQEMMPMMEEMHEKHAAAANVWAASEDGVFVVRSGQLHKYDQNLKLVKTIDLPKEEESESRETEDAKASKNAEGKMQEMQKMKQMMARMHARLPVGIRLTDNAIFISQGDHLLSYDHELKLNAQTKLPAAKPMHCPMCERMMKKMQQKMHGGQTYTCPLHPQIRQKVPGRCAICGIELVLAKDAAENARRRGSSESE